MKRWSEGFRTDLNFLAWALAAQRVNYDAHARSAEIRGNTALQLRREVMQRFSMSI